MVVPNNAANVPPPPTTEAVVPPAGCEAASAGKQRPPLTSDDVSAMVAGGPRLRRQLLEQLPHLSEDGFLAAVFWAGLLWSPSLFFVAFSQFLEPSEGRKPGGVERNRLVTRQLRSLAGWAGDRSVWGAERPGNGAWRLDPAWLLLAASLGRLDLVLCLATPGHAGVDRLLTDAFTSEQPTTPAELVHDIATVIVAINHPLADDARAWLGSPAGDRV
ncbi:hypothetical protein Pla175_27710 [Pirellulimonas nuda]|uniref:Uncharacterized protein n=1 Tax=Pirellulimonas nuda TaxID=2528009 RepID=A0A518DD21_9BACT|nr:hypothetical protein [Pirellulimonas nuda]QDU89382.1 hypothetical protein Pla175_27710 [Pirellulimonas nuda]